MAKNFNNVNHQEIGWFENLEKLESLYTWLYRTARIKCELEFFRAHFINLNTDAPILWYGSNSELVNMFYDLIDGCAIPAPSDPAQIICNHFCKPDRSRLKPKSLVSERGRTPSLNVHKYLSVLFMRIEVKRDVG